VLGYGDHPDEFWFKSPADSRLNGLLSFDVNSLENPVLENYKDAIVESEGLESPSGSSPILDEEPEVCRLTVLFRPTLHSFSILHIFLEHNHPRLLGNARIRAQKKSSVTRDEDLVEKVQYILCSHFAYILI
jgi:hypothetical protein